MNTVIKQLPCNPYTVLILDSAPPYDWKSGVRINGKTYETDIVYDLRNAIAVKASGNFVGLELEYMGVNSPEEPKE